MIPNHEGRVVQADGGYLAGVYTTGWIKRGPVGLIGHTKSDATETIKHLVADADALNPAPEPAAEAVTTFLAERGVGHVEWFGWMLLDAYEQSLGEPRGRERVKVVPREEMLAVIRGEL